MKKLTVTQIKHLLSRADALLTKAHNEAVENWMSANPEPEIPESPKYVGVSEIHKDPSLLKLKSGRQLRQALIEHIQGLPSQALDNPAYWSVNCKLDVEQLIKQPREIVALAKKHDAARKVHQKWEQTRDRYITSLCSKSAEMITDLTDRLYLCDSEEAMDQLEALKTFKF